MLILRDQLRLLLQHSPAILSYISAVCPGEVSAVCSYYSKLISNLLRNLILLNERIGRNIYSNI